MNKEQSEVYRNERNAEGDDDLDNFHVPFKTVGTRVAMSKDRYRELTDDNAHLRDRVEADGKMIGALVEALEKLVELDDGDLQISNSSFSYGSENLDEVFDRFKWGRDALAKARERLGE